MTRPRRRSKRGAVHSILSLTPLDQLEAEVSRRRKAVRSGEAEVEGDADETLSEFAVTFLYEQVNVFRCYVNDAQRAGEIPERMPFDSWLELWYSDWEDAYWAAVDDDGGDAS